MSNTNNVLYQGLNIKKSSFENFKKFLLKHKGKLFFVISFAVISALFIYMIMKVLNPSSLQSCKDDGFEPVHYTVTEADGSKKTKFVKIKFVEDTANDEYYNFKGARKECRKLDSDLWEIADGQAEWDAIIQKAKDKKKTFLWLNTNTSNSQCPNGQESCRELEALQGKGIPVKWPSFPNSTFSRLDNAVTDEKRCVYVDNQNSNLLWRAGSCTSINAWGLCVKRNCSKE